MAAAVLAMLATRQRAVPVVTILAGQVAVREAQAAVQAEALDRMVGAAAGQPGAREALAVQARI